MSDRRLQPAIPVSWYLVVDLTLGTFQHERLAAETAEEREVRLQCDRQRHRDQQLVQSQLPLFEQHSIRAKMHKFHAHFTTLLAARSVNMYHLFGEFSWSSASLGVC